jgi:glycosyltransferase involved in cell wall biosynthesis
MYFGINTEFFKRLPPPKPAPGEPIRLFSIGNDATRDWNTVIEAFGGDPRFHLTIVCQWLPDTGISQYGNVHLARVTEMAETLRDYAAADFVVVSMHDNIYSGITVALEAIAMNRPVVCSRTGGVPTYFDEEEVFYVPVGDPAAMREAVLAADEETRRRKTDRAWARFCERDYSTYGVMGRYAALTRELMDLAQPEFAEDARSRAAVKQA